MKRAPIFLAVVLACASAFGAEADYRITAVTGNAAVVPKDSTIASPARAGFPLAPGDRIVTDAGGGAEVAAREGTVFQLGEKSSFSVDEPRPSGGSFRLALGRLLAKFAPATGSGYQVATPVAVAAVRGTELALDVADTGAMNAAVVEGEVAFRPVEDDTTTNGPVREEVVGASQGLTAEPGKRPEKLPSIPVPLVPALAQFKSIRERVPSLREHWPELAAGERIRLRQEALRERIRWQIPENVRQNLSSPRQRVAPLRVPPPSRRPARPRR
ncbi:MAG: FecR domain-containing protein [Elusimicrobia bacterium]|nr:FecR domain-containing protein [Elusimicrobiota bacterium]